MNKFLLIMFFIFTTSIASSQPFEGKIIYVNKYNSKLTDVLDESWSAMYGTTKEFFIKDGNYKSVAEDAIFQWQIYNNKENRLYNKFSNDEKAFWFDCSISKDQVIKAKLNKGVVEILDNTCDELILTCKSGVQKYYFTSTIPADAVKFKNHKYGNWYDYLLKSHALPLKTIIESEKFIVESVAIKVVSLELDDNVFQIPKGVVTEKSP